jgi:hypothetical protein
VGAGYVAYAAVTSIATIRLYIAYAIPIFLRLRIGDAWDGTNRGALWRGHRALPTT